MNRFFSTKLEKEAARSKSVYKILHANEAENQPSVVYRIAGDNHFLVEYGEMEFDMKIRFRVHLLEKKLRQLKIKGIEELSPGVRYKIYFPFILISHFSKILDHYK